MRKVKETILNPKHWFRGSLLASFIPYGRYVIKMSAETEANIMPLVEIASRSQTCMAVIFKEVNFLRKFAPAPWDTQTTFEFDSLTFICFFFTFGFLTPRKINYPLSKLASLYKLVSFFFKIASKIHSVVRCMESEFFYKKRQLVEISWSFFSKKW